MESGLPLDVVFQEEMAILQLLTGVDQTLLIRGDSLLVLNLSLNVIDGIRRLDIKGDGLTRQCR